MFWYLRENCCCGGHDVMIVAAYQHQPIAVVQTSGYCGGFVSLHDHGWTPCAKPTVLTARGFDGFWRPVFFAREEDSHGQRWERVTRQCALSLAPELIEELNERPRPVAS